MTEPTYEYVKGQGWVLETTKTQLDLGHELVKFEIRKPEIGEFYMRFEEPRTEDEIRDLITRRSYFSWYCCRGTFKLDNYFTVVLTRVES